MKRQTKKIIFSLNFLALIIFLYLFLAPLYPLLKYQLVIKPQNQTPDYQSQKISEQTAPEALAHLPKTKNSPTNRLIIPKIGVNAPIVEAKSARVGLNRGAWHLPNTSDPTQGGNMVITGHRFKYLPPNNTTFYLLDKLAVGDKISVIWRQKPYYYEVEKIKIVAANDQSIIQPTTEPTLTLFTCQPLYSQKQRLVIIARPSEK